MAVELDEHDQPAVGRPIRRSAAVSQPPEPPAIGADDVETVAALEDDFEHVEELGDYDIYHRIDPHAPKKSDDDNDDDDDEQDADEFEGLEDDIDMYSIQQLRLI